MFIQASQLLGKPIELAEEPGEFGQVRDIVVDPNNGRILALAVHPPGWFARMRYLATQDILDFDDQGIIINDPESVADRHELIRVEQALASHIKILGQAAVTESGRSLGTIDDVLVDLEAWLIAKYYIKHLMSERILPAEDVHSITPKAVVFFDRVNGPAATTAETETAAA